MKKLLILFVIILSFSLHSQTWLQIQKVNGEKDSVKLSDISRIYFTNTIPVFTCGTSTVEYFGKSYNSVKIGTQCWLKENLNVGTRINGSEPSANNGIIEKYCYADNEVNCDVYGGFYQWNEMMNYNPSPGAQGICPMGWHVPTYEELAELKANVSNSGNSLKATGQGSGNGAGTNTSGFSALLTGERNNNGQFYNIATFAHFQSSSTYSSTNAYYLALTKSDNGIYLDYNLKGSGFSIRCIKDNQ